VQEPLFSQHPHRVRLDLGRQGVRDAAERGDAIVIVDVLRFSSCVAAAVERGASVHPCAFDAEAADVARRVGGRIASAPPGSRAGFALVPEFSEAAARETIVLRTLNGAECTLLASSAPRVFAGSLLNASAIAHAAAEFIASSDVCLTVVACGERRTKPVEGEEQRFAIEDYLGAGAIISAIGGDLSPEARVCAAAFEGSRERLLDLLLDCASGRQLRSWGLEADVRFAAQLDACGAVPVLRDGRYERSAV
jgi:2-phosphosulfolactate phosphatase